MNRLTDLAAKLCDLGTKFAHGLAKVCYLAACKLSRIGKVEVRGCELAYSERITLDYVYRGHRPGVLCYRTDCAFCVLDDIQRSSPLRSGAGTTP